MSQTNELATLNRTEKAAIIQQALQAQGFRDADIARLMQVSRARVCDVNKKVQAGTLNPLVSKAKKAVKQLLEGQKVGDMREVRGSDVLTAAKMVLDRVDPVTQKVESTHHTYNHELNETDREKYKKVLGIIDAEYEVVEEKKCVQLAPSSESSSSLQLLPPSALESIITSTKDTTAQPVVTPCEESKSNESESIPNETAVANS
jgi:predicted XRE-type DNA-binding protein